MSKQLQRGLDQLRQDLISQVGVVEQMIQLSVRSLVERRTDLADRVIETDQQVDEQDIRIEEECLKLLALHQPVATDLRWLTTVIKVNGELERMADLACNIAERTKALDLHPLFPVPEELNEMVSAVSEMVRDALDAFVEGDATKADTLMERDDHVDALNRVVIANLLDRMQEKSEYIVPAMQCFSASRHLERIGDLAENLGEEIVYLVRGEIIRHHHGHRSDSIAGSGSRGAE